MADVMGPVGNDSGPPPENFVGLIDKHLTRATDSLKTLMRYVLLTFTLLVCALALVVGTAFVVVHLQGHISSTSGIACGGVFSFLAVAATRVWRLRRKSGRDRRE
jgi:hypothetical protein